MRYGNKAFRDWLDQINPIVDDYLKQQLPDNLQNAAFELRSYLLDSFRNKQRIDYRTGHEFQFFLFQLFRLGINTEMIYAEQNSILQVYQFCKKSEDNFLFQPAGSHRIW